jgi:P-type Cu+ transporter
MNTHHGHRHGSVAMSHPGEMAKDPICGMMVLKATALKSERGGRTYYFCDYVCSFR